MHLPRFAPTGTPRSGAIATAIVGEPLDRVRHAGGTDNLGLGHPLKFLWEERDQHLTSYLNFWKQFYRKSQRFVRTVAFAELSVDGKDVRLWIHARV